MLSGLLGSLYLDITRLWIWGIWIYGFRIFMPKAKNKCKNRKIL